MSLLIVTSVRSVPVDHQELPQVLQDEVEKDFMAQTGECTGTGTGGDSVYKFLFGEQAHFFKDETHPDFKHSKTGTVAMASAGEDCNASQMDDVLIDDRRIHVGISAKMFPNCGANTGMVKGIILKLRLRCRSKDTKCDAVKKHHIFHSANAPFLGGYFRCGATDHIARDCDERSNSKQQGPKYVLKDDQTQHGGDGRKRYILFDEDLQDNRETEGKEQTKRQKEDHRRSDDSAHRHRYDDEKHSRHSREDERRNQERRSHDIKNGAEERSEGRDHRDHRRRSYGSTHREEGDCRRSESDRHRWEDYNEKNGRDRDDDDAYRERKHRW